MNSCKQKAPNLNEMEQNYPFGALLIAVFLTISFVVAVNIIQLRSYEEYSVMIQKVRLLEELKGRIIFFDEVLSLSAQLLVATGEEEWRERYAEARPQLEAALIEVIEANPNTKSSASAAQTSSVNIFITDLENAAFIALERGDRGKARSILTSDTYNEYKAIYAGGMRDFSVNLSEELENFNHQIARRSYFSVGISTIIILFVLGLWFFVLRFIYRWRKMVVEMNLQLDRRVSERTEELERERQRSVYNAKMAALGEMAGAIAHEVNNPLGIICLKSQLIRDLVGNEKANPQIVDHSEGIKRTAQRISKITEGLLMFSREGDHDPLVFTEIAPIVESTIELCRSKIVHRGVEFFVPNIPKSIKVNCRPTQISQVLLNLLNNAYDAVEKKNHKNIVVECLDFNDRVELAVIDNGEGIDPSIEGKIMEPFFTTKSVGKGTGLGLSISKGIMEDHGGSLSFQRLQFGTRFCMAFPKTQHV